MRKSLFLFAILGICFSQSIYAQDTIPNPSFENWINSGVYDEPAGWTTGNSIVGNLIQTAQKSSDAYSGSYSLKLTSMYFALGGLTIPGVATTGSISLDANFNPTFSGGTPFNKVPQALTGVYKHSPGAIGDSAAISITLTKYDSLQDTFLVVGLGAFFSADTVSTWTPFVIPIMHLLPVDPDSLLILITSSISASPAQGGTLWLDDLGFTWPIGIQNTGNQFVLNVFPNPASDFLNIAISETHPGLRFYVYNLLGENLIQTNFNGKLQQIDISTLNKGLYIYRLIENDGTILDSGKFQVTR